MLKVVSLLMLLCFCLPVCAQAFRSETYCRQLADIGGKTFNVKKSGGSLGSILQQVRYVLASEPQKLQAAEGVIVAIYGDGSIKSASQAYGIVYSTCKQ